MLDRKAKNGGLESKSAYRGQVACAKKRSIAWGFTYDSWMAWWDSTGHWEERGSKRGNFCMCRKNDVGPYTIENVYCATVGHNHSVLNDESRRRVLEGAARGKETQKRNRLRNVE